MTTPSHHRGFTLTELIVTLVLVGILAVFVAPKFAGMNTVRERSEYDKVLSAITYARKAAVAKRRYACVSVSSTAVTLTVDANPPESTATPFGGTCPFATALDLASRDQACSASNQTCLKYSTIASTPGTFQFDPLGRASTTVTITMAGYPPITVEGETGYVHCLAPRSAQRGLSLIELIIFIVVVSIGLAGVLMAINTASRSQRRPDGAQAGAGGRGVAPRGDRAAALHLLRPGRYRRVHRYQLRGVHHRRPVDGQPRQLGRRKDALRAGLLRQRCRLQRLHHDGNVERHLPAVELQARRATTPR